MPIFIGQQYHLSLHLTERETGVWKPKSLWSAWKCRCILESSFKDGHAVDTLGVSPIFTVTRQSHCGVLLVP